MNTIHERVIRGAALLDEREPGWWQRISLDRLFIGSVCDCILGQLYRGSYAKGLVELNVDSRDHGFMWAALEDSPAEDAEIDALTDAWRELIRSRPEAMVTA